MACNCQSEPKVGPKNTTQSQEAKSSLFNKEVWYTRDQTIRQRYPNLDAKARPKSQNWSDNRTGNTRGKTLELCHKEEDELALEEGSGE